MKSNVTTQKITGEGKYMFLVVTKNIRDTRYELIKADDESHAIDQYSRNYNIGNNYLVVLIQKGDLPVIFNNGGNKRWEE